MAEKKGILTVSFGTTYEEARREAIDALEKELGNLAVKLVDLLA